MGSVYIVVSLTDKHNLWGRLREWQDITRKVAGYENPRAGHAPPLRYLYLYNVQNTKVNYYNLYGFVHRHTCSGFSYRHLF